MFFRRLGLLLLLLASLSVGSVSAQDGAASIAVAPFFGGAFKSGEWLPLRITVTNNGPDRQGLIRLGGTAGASFDAAVELPRGARKSLVMYMRPDSFARSVKARLLEGERELASADVEVHGWSARTQVVGLLMARPLTAPRPDSGNEQIPVETTVVAPEDIPARFEGLSAFDALLLDGLPLDALSAEQATALVDWVHGGGQLVVSAADGGRTLASLPEALRVAEAGAAEERAPAGTLLAELGAEARITGVTLAPAGGATALDALAVQKDLGLGRVTVLGFSMSDPQLQRLPPENALWPALIEFPGVDPNFPPDINPDEMQAQQLTQTLFNLPSLALPPLGVLAALLLGYILLVGPVLYFVLRRFDRQAWAWVAIPVLTVLFSAATYGYGLRIRGDDVILNQISVVQPYGDRARARTYAGIFSPASRAYDVAVDGDALTRPLQFDPRTWGRETGQSPSGGQYFQGGGGVRNLRVSQWAMSTFAAEAIVPFERIEAQLELGDNVLRGTVRNGGTATLRDAAVVQGGQAFLVGNLAPGEEKPVEMRLDDSVLPGGAPLSMTIFKDRWNQNMAPPPELRVPIQIIDSLYGFSPWSRSPTPVLLGWLDHSPLRLQLSDGRVQHQELTLVEVPIELTYGETVTFGRGWTRAVFQTGPFQQGGCMTQWGQGAMLMSSEPFTATLELPPAARTLDIAAVELFAEVEGPPPGRLLVETYDWQAGTWTRQSESFGPIELSEPARFVRGGELRLRLTPDVSGIQGSCMHVGASIRGTR